MPTEPKEDVTGPLRKLKLNFLQPPGAVLIWDCGHSAIWWAENSKDIIPLKFRCPKCTANLPLDYYQINPDIQLLLKEDLGELENSLEKFSKKIRELEYLLASLVCIYREQVKDPNLEVICSKTQNELLALSYDLIISAQLFKESYIKGFSEFLFKMKLTKQADELSIELGINQVSHQLTPEIEKTSSINPINISFHQRIGSSAKSLLIWIRAFQDACAKIILIQEQGGTPGNYTSMSKAIGKPENPINKFVEENLQGYLSWFEKSRKLRNNLKQGAWFSRMNIQGSKIELSTSHLEGEENLIISLPYFTESIEWCNKITESLIPAISSYIDTINIEK
ncbi:MAG: hypothetical protein V3U87_13300 [Methylococcaceae bacterium]